MNNLAGIVNRHIHLDYHTSGLIGPVADEFDPGEFAKTLVEAEVGGVCLFARCHHGYCYYPSKHGTPHPHLREPDLLGRQLTAIRSADMQTGLYTTICWDELSAERHPEWVCRTDDNKVMKGDPLTGEERGIWEAGWTFLCWNSPYRDYLKEHLKELLESYQADFIFLDILFNRTPCVCPHCVKRMLRHNLDPTCAAEQMKNSIDSAREFMEEISEFIHQLNPDIAPFYNSRLRVTGEVPMGSMPEIKDQGMVIIESLPSGPWGYDHFPIFAKYFQHVRLPSLGHTGKFQKMWGDFGGLKNQAALDYEVIRMMAHGVAACVGDQLHPRGSLDRATYRLIGKTYAKVKPLEKYLLPSEPIDEIGVLLTNTPRAATNIGGNLDSETGAMKMLSQLHFQFSFLDTDSDFSSYKILILPDEVLVDEPLKEKLDAYVEGGGKIIASYGGGMDASGRFALEAMPMLIKNDLPYQPFYFHPTGDLTEKGIIEDTDHVMYLAGKDVAERHPGYTVCCRVTEPYFNRAWNHFCSHLQTPPGKRTEKPAMLHNGANIVYFPGKVFACYQLHGPGVLKRLVNHAIDLLLDRKLIQSNLPSTAEALLRRDSAGNVVLSVIHYVHQRRCENIDIIEDVLPLHNVEISLYCGFNPKEVIERRSGQPIRFRADGERVNFTLSRVDGFAVVVLEPGKET